MTNLAGIWWSDLGWKMVLTVDPNGGLSGTYSAFYGRAEHKYILAGRYDSEPPVYSMGMGTSISWAVTHFNEERNAHATEAWSGQYFDNPERILAHWLLTHSTRTKSSFSTNMGTDTFTRNPPSAADIEAAKAHQFGHPDPEDIIARWDSGIKTRDF